MAEDFPEFQSGDELEPYHLNIVYRELKRWRKAKGAGNVDVDFADGSGGAPPVITGYDFSRNMIAQTGGTIAAISGSTPGSGTVTRYFFDGTTLTAAETYTAFNLSSNTVAASTWVILAEVDGFWFIVFENCP